MKDELLTALAPHGQEHLLAFWDALDQRGRESLAGQIRPIDWDLIERLYRGKDQPVNYRELAERAGPPPAIRLETSRNRFTPRQARQRGNRAIAAGELGVILVAGGQGTRLGFEHPKGMFPLGPVSGRSLFQIHVEKILATGRRHGVRIPLYLMTSPATHEETKAFFNEDKPFGLNKEDSRVSCYEDLRLFCREDLHIFCQGTMPVVDASGKVLLEGRDRIALSPDGHGGTLAALARSGALADIEQRGIRHLFYFQVDNPLVDICGAEFVGYHLLAEAEMSTQVVAKRQPQDQLGNVVQVDGRLVVIEYSDLPDEIAQRRNPDGSLQIWAGSIAVHIMDAGFLRRMAGAADALPFHIARKRVACIGPQGEPVQPQGPNAIKFERFIFDLIPSAARAIVVEVDPADAFAPLKNAPGAAEDTPESVQRQMVAQHRGWLRRAGAEVTAGVAVEICPLWALDAEETAAKIKPGSRITRPAYFC